MHRIRTAIFWLHLVVGLSIALVIAGLAGTGLTMAFQRQIVSAVERGDGHPPHPGAQRLDVEALLARVRDAQPDATISGITLQANPNAAASIALGRDRRMQLNTYTGAVVGADAPRLRAFFRTMEDYHRWLALTGDWKQRGKAVTGAAAIALAGLIVSGLVLWFPRSLRWSSFRAGLLLNWRLRGKSRDWNWHNVVGFWLCLPMLVIALSGIVISQDWANRLLFASVGDTPPPPRDQGAQRREGENREEGQRRPAPLNLAGLNDLWSSALAKAGPDWSSISLQLGAGRGRDRGGTGGGLTFAFTTGNPANPMNRRSITLDRESGDIRREETFASQPPGRRARSLVVPIHRGEILGLPGQTIAALTAAGALLLVYTGVSLSIRRFFGKKKKYPKARVAEQELAAVG